jgi:uncharacterized protein (TIGR03435 family)
MTFSGFWHVVWVAAVVNHLWQSTLVAGMAWLLASALRRNQARARYWVWMVASVKFLVPFSLLIAAGERLHEALAKPIDTPALANGLRQITVPFAQASTEPLTLALSGMPVANAAHRVDLLPWILVTIWASGAALILFTWASRWLALGRVVRKSAPMMRLGDVPVLASPTLLEPGIFGIFRPVLLLPEGITDRLSARQMETIFAHEMAHVRRRDNLTSAIHMVAQAAFWFHPALWFIQKRLLEERERACDEAVLQSGSEAGLYAESILSVCRFYVESPTVCVSGVTGSDLKQRIIRIMTERVASKLELSRKLLLGLAGAVAVAVPVVFGLVHVGRVQAQTQEQAASDLAGTWQGTLQVGKGLRTVIKITKDPSGVYKSVFYSIDQGGQPLPVPTTTLQGSTVKMAIPMIDWTYEGKISADGKTISGTATQGTPRPLDFTRATVETAWAIPEPPPRVPPMAADANPTFEVATIKPSKPDAQGLGFRVQGRHFSTLNTNMSQILSFAYGVHPKQIVGAPAWFETDKFDISAQPDIDGQPNDRQLKSMVQKLIAERFKLTFHHEKKELSVYTLTVAKTGPKMTKSEATDSNGLPGLFFRGLGKLSVRNATMVDFSQLMQSAVLDRPVVDQTDLPGRWDFQLKWTPDDSQFHGMGANVPPPTDAADAPPDLFTAIQAQIGLKLEPTKAAADVLVIDHVEKPSDN